MNTTSGIATALTDEALDKPRRLCIVRWEGRVHCAYLNDFRVAGGKPWAGGTTEKEWPITLREVIRAFPELQRAVGMDYLGKRVGANIPSPWRPISTAPKGGEVLLFAEETEEQFVAFLGTDPEDGDQQWVFARGGGISFIVRNPTHWMPLPPSPSSPNVDAATKLDQQYLVWSNEHRAWWAPDRCGYTRIIANAGRYDRAEALTIAGARDGGWRLNKGNPDEIAIPEQDAIDQYADITRAQQRGEA